MVYAYSSFHFLIPADTMFEPQLLTWSAHQTKVQPSPSIARSASANITAHIHRMRHAKPTHFLHTEQKYTLLSSIAKSASAKTTVHIHQVRSRLFILSEVLQQPSILQLSSNSQQEAGNRSIHKLFVHKYDALTLAPSNPISS